MTYYPTAQSMTGINPILLDIPDVIETSRLRLEVPKAGMGEKVHQAIADGYEDYVKWLFWSPILPTIDSIEEECRRDHAAFILRNLIRYVIFDKTTGKALGRCAMHPSQVSWIIPQFGLSYFIRKSERGKGFATEATRALALLAFDTLKAKKVEIYCDPENTASIRIPLKLNFQLEYTQRGGWPGQNGELSQLQTYSLFSKNLLI